MKRPIPFSYVASAAWLACAAQAVLGIPEGLTLCPVKLLTGHNCPGCGMGHAVVYAMRGDFAASFHSHPLGIPLLVVWTGWLLREAYSARAAAVRAASVTARLPASAAFLDGRGLSSNVASRP